MPGWLFMHMWDESEPVYFAQARRHNFAWHSPVNSKDRLGWLQIKGVSTLFSACIFSCKQVMIIVLHLTSLSTLFNSFSASGNFCHLLITFANSLDPDQARQNVGSDLDPNCLTLWWYSWEIILEKLILKKIFHRRQKSMQNYPSCKVLSHIETRKRW